MSGWAPRVPATGEENTHRPPLTTTIPLADPAADLAPVAPIAQEWEALADRCDAGPLLRPGWLRAWWRSFGTGHLELLTARGPTDDRLVAVLALRRRGGAVSSPTNWHSGEFGMVAEDRGAADGLVRALVERRPRRMDLSFLNPPQADLLGRRAREGGYLVQQRSLRGSPYLAVHGSWADYEQSISGRVRRELARRRRRLEEQGRLELVVEDPGDHLEQLLTEGLEVEGSGWKTARGTAIQSRPETRRFYTEIASWARDRGWLRLAFLRLDGRVLAFDLSLERAGVHYLLKTGYDPAFAAFGPGKLLRYEMLARAFTGRLRCYEFLGQDDAWKLEWTTTTRDLVHARAFLRTPRGVLEWSAQVYGRPVAAWVAQRAGVRGRGR